MSELTHAQKVEMAKLAMRNGESSGADEMLAWCDHDNLLQKLEQVTKERNELLMFVQFVAGVMKNPRAENVSLHHVSCNAGDLLAKLNQ